MNGIIIVKMFLGFLLYQVWGFRKLPKENSQILAVIPVRQRPDGNWEGINLTYYGVLIANAIVAASFSFMILMGSIGVDLQISLCILTVLLCITLPAAGILSRWIENKPNTFSTGAASILGLIGAGLTGAIIQMGSWGYTGVTPEPIPMLAGISIAYCFGEGLGRLACISFGCCYGKPLQQSSPLVKKIFKKFHFIFYGQTKKIAYAHGWDGLPVVPVQAITAIVCITSGMLGMILFSNSLFTETFVFTLFVSQGWRLFSEFFRGDFRGSRKFTAYQYLSIFSMVLGILFVLVFPAPSFHSVELISGLGVPFNPGVILLFAVIWFFIVTYLGKSKVIGSNLSFFVHMDRI